MATGAKPQADESFRNFEGNDNQQFTPKIRNLSNNSHPRGVLRLSNCKRSIWTNP